MEVIMHFNPDFRTKFVSYLANGIPVSIADDEIPLFYKALSNYINDAKNDFMAFYGLGDDCVVLSDRQDDYLRVSYEKDKIEFFTIANQINTQDDPLSYQKKLGEAFLGVVLFVESMSPSEDSLFIPEAFHDKWKLQ